MFGIFKGNNPKDLGKYDELKDLKIFEKIYESIIQATLDLDQVTQSIADAAADHLGTVAIVLTLLTEDKKNIYAHTISSGVIGGILTKAMGSREKFRILLPTDQDYTLTLKSIRLRKEQYSDNVADMTSPPAPKKVAALAQSLYGIKGVVSVPIFLNDEPVGAIICAFKYPYSEITEHQLYLIKRFANFIAFAIDRSKSYEKEKHNVALLQVQNKDLQSLYNLTSQISTSLDPTQVAQTAVNSLPQDKFIIGALLNTYDKEKNKLEVKALTQNGISYEVTKAIGDPVQYGLDLSTNGAEFNMSARALKQGVSQFSNKLEDFLAPSVPAALIPIIEKILQIKSVATYPLKIRDTIIGTLTYFIKEKTVEELTEGEKQLLGTYTYHITISLENAELYKQQQETQANLENALMEVQALRQHEQDMIDIMGHELRTPISIVRNALGMLELELKNTGEIKKENLAKFLDISMESARREVKLVETLLSSAKADSRGFQLLFEKVDFLDVINDSLEFFTREAEKKGLQIKYTKPNEEFFVYADRTRIQEVMDNLLSNAVKYTDKGFIKINVRKDGEFAWVDVTDTGIGMDEKDLKSIGQKFYRVDQYMDKEETVNEKPNIIRPGGTGLGLYVTFSLVKVMDGKVEVKSQLGVGTTFSYSMPLYKGQESKQEQRKP